MDNYSLPLCKCYCVHCGRYFTCITPTWWCKECNEKRLKSFAKKKRWGEVKIIKALLLTVWLFVITFALVSLPVLFGVIGGIVLLAIIFLVIFFAILFGI